MAITDASDPHYLERPSAFCWSNLGQHKNSPDSEGNCIPAPDLTLYKYPDEAHAEDMHVAYASAAFPFLKAVHRFRQTNSWPQQMDIAPFTVPSGSEPGQYIMHYLWRGYRDCIDIDVLPASQVVPDTSDAKYGQADSTLERWQRIDHCQYEQGSYAPWVGTFTTCNAATRQSTCFILPPPGLTNTNGQTREEALAACQERCNRNVNQCKSVVVVPGTMPEAAVEAAGVALGTATNIPWGSGNCNSDCLASNPAGSSVCYGLKGIANKVSALDGRDSNPLVESEKHPLAAMC